MAEDSKTLVGSRELAKLFDLSDRRIQQLTADGTLTAEVVKVNGHDVRRYDLLPTVHDYVKSLQDKVNNKEAQQKNADLTDSKLQEEIRYKKGKADKIEMELQELSGQMHRAEDVEKVFTDHAQAVRAMFLALPGVLAVDCADAATPKEAEGIIRRAVLDDLKILEQYQYDSEEFRALVKEREQWISDEYEQDEEEDEPVQRDKKSKQGNK